MEVRIANIKGRQILDSRGNPTLEVEIYLNNGYSGRASVPSGASKGTKEAVELRDYANKNVLEGKSVNVAVKKLEEIESIIKREKFNRIESFDKFLIQLDGTENKSNLGGNVTLGLSIAFAQTMAKLNNFFLYEYINREFINTSAYRIPVPLFNFINGGIHADNNLSIQEFFIIPAGDCSYYDRLFGSVEVFYRLKRILKENNKNILVGDEGGFAPSFKNDEEALIYLTNAIATSRKVNCSFAIGLDCAATQLFQNNKYSFFKLNTEPCSYMEFINIYMEWIEKYNIILIEDPFAEDDYDAWREFTAKAGDKITIVGDDLYCTNVKYIQKGVKEKLSNAVLIKPNQIGTIYETYLAVKLARDNGFKTVFSHRSGETEDTWASHLAVGFDADYVKFGGLSRSERLAKYNELLRIEENILQSNK